MKNLWIKIGVGLFVSTMALMLILGNLLIAKRIENLEDSVYQTFTSRTTQSIMTEKKVKDYEDLGEYLNPDYSNIYDDEGKLNEVTYNDDGIIENHGKFAFKSINRESYVDHFLTDSLNWDYLSDLIVELFGASISLNGVFETPERIATVIMAEKGWESGLWKEVHGSTKENDVEKNNKIKLFKILFKNNIQKAGLSQLEIIVQVKILGKTSDIVKIKANIDLFTFDDYFETDDSSGKVTYFDFSDGLQKEEWYSIKEWNKKQISDFVSTIGISFKIKLAASNPTFGLYIPLNALWSNYLTINAASWEYLNNSSNTYYISMDKLRSFLDEFEGIEYKTLRINAKSNSGKFTWELDNNEGALKLDNQKINSIGEALMYKIYKTFDYSKYFNRSLEIDSSNGLNEMNKTQGLLVENQPYYDYRFIPELSGIRESEYGMKASEYEAPKKMDEDPAMMWEYGQKECSFSEFMAINKAYQPFLRVGEKEDKSDWPIDWFYHDLSKLLIEGVSLNELQKPNNV